MSEIHNILEQILDVDGHIRIRPYQVELHSQLQHTILWQTQKNSGLCISHYGDESWLATGEKQAITFHDAQGELGHELRALALGMLHHGAGEGMLPIKWNTTKRIIRCSKRFGLWLQKQNIAALHLIDTLPALRLRHLIDKYLTENNAQRHLHVAQDISSALYWWKLYGIVQSTKILTLFEEMLAPYIAKKSEYRQKHSIIPTRVMKILLKECEQKLELAERHFEEWKKIQTKLNQRIAHLGSGHFNRDTYINALTEEEKSKLNELHVYFESIRRYIFVLVLAYSGMRHSEVMALNDGSAFSRNGEFYITSSLSKTTDDKQELEWVVSEHAYRGVELLTKMNKIYRERAGLLVEYYGDKLPPNRVEDMKFGRVDTKLFQVRHCKQSALFSEQAKATKNGFNNINTLFSIPVEQRDIEQLQKLGCNIQSVSSNHKNFRKPYQVGIPFNFTSHQFRHTFAWFIVANRLGDLDDIKYQFKHLEKTMSLVYSHRGFDSMEELLHLMQSIEEYLTQQAMTDMVQAAEQGHLAGRGGQKFIERLKSLLGNDFTSGSSPHFANMQELLTYTAKHSSGFRGLSHGYCTKGTGCQIRNAADPSHCINCDSYIATPKHLPHWKVIKQKCEHQLAVFEKFSDEMQSRFASFKGALLDNLYAANSIIQQLEVTIKEA